MYLTQYLSKHELNSLDKDRLTSQLSDRLHLNQLLARPINRTLLDEVRLVLEGKPVPHHRVDRNGPVRVIKL